MKINENCTQKRHKYIISKKIKEKFSPYKVIAEKYNVDIKYVYKIASGSRKGVRGKALAIKNELKNIVNATDKDVKK